MGSSLRLVGDYGRGQSCRSSYGRGPRNRKCQLALLGRQFTCVEEA